MQKEKTPLEVLQEKFDYLTDLQKSTDWLKKLYEQKVRLQESEIELLRKGMRSEPAISFLDFEKAKIPTKPNFLDLQMLN